MNEDSINSFLQEFSLQSDQASPNELFSAVPEQETTETESVPQEPPVSKLVHLKVRQISACSRMQSNRQSRRKKKG